MPPLTRSSLITTLVNALEATPTVLTLWEAGSKAFDRIDEWSDVDFHCVVQDGQAEAAFQAVERALNALPDSGIRTVYVIPQPAWHGHRQRFYKLLHCPDHLMVDFLVIEAQHPDKFLERERHGQPFVYFDRGQVMEQARTSVDRAAFQQKLNTDVQQCIQRIQFFHFLVDKELKREHFLDAYHMYQRMVLQPLTSLLRAHYEPFHYDFGLRYVYDELPASVTERLEQLHLFQDLATLRLRYEQALLWFGEIVPLFSEAK